MNVRYFLYLNLMSMLVNAIINVPSILYEDRFNGAIMSMILAIPLSTVLTIIFSKCLIKFPNQGLPEILKLTIPNWVRTPVLLYLGIMWYIGGLLVLVVFAIICVRYINPDVSLVFTLILFMLIAGWGALQSSKTVLYILEIIIILNVPFIFFIIIKAVSSPFMNWKEVLSMGSYVWMWPTWKSLAASTYLFIGYINMAIFNRAFDGKFSLKFYWVIPIIGLLNFISSFAIPIGFHGPQTVDNYIYPWISTADSLKMEYGFIERVIFLFLLLYISISLLFGIVCWHVALEVLKSTFESKKRSSWNRRLPYGILALFLILPLFILKWANEPFLIKFSEVWISHRLIAEILLVAGVYILTRRKKKYDETS
jgi:hypothetical protein